MTNDLRRLAATDRQHHETSGADLNPFSTHGARLLWQKGWDGVTPADLVVGSGNWRYWERGRQARLLEGGAP